MSQYITTLNSLLLEAEQAIACAVSVADLEHVRVEYLGRQGSVTAILKTLKDLSEQDKRVVGPVAQEVRERITALLRERLSFFESSGVSHPDYTTLPSKLGPIGHLHPLTILQDDVIRIFRDLNFSVIEGPELESEYYNFDALNIAPHHPARDMWDTFWIKQDRLISDPKRRMLLRTHTSPMQVRFMEGHKPPFQLIVPGRVFRYEATDATHEVNFYQLEGLMVGPSVTLANFKYVIETFFQKFFGKSVTFRYRPSYFPFVEPGLEVDIRVPGKKGNQWLEVMGAGMVHPSVFEYAHYDPRSIQGFAFGVGIDRLLMIKHHIPDVRMLYSGDLRVVQQQF
jgi:phenylalanyl-tRNA synthetase alpha chain